MSTLARKYRNFSSASMAQYGDSAFAGGSGAGLYDGESRRAEAEFQVLLYCPSRLEEAGEIIDLMDAEHVIVLNFESTPEEMVRRLLDFLSGATYAKAGRIERLAAKTFALIPLGVSFEDESELALY